VPENETAGPIFVPTTKVVTEFFRLGPSVSTVTVIDGAEEISFERDEHALSTLWRSLKGEIERFGPQLKKDLVSQVDLNSNESHLLDSIGAFKRRLRSESRDPALLISLEKALDDLTRPEEMSYSEWMKCLGFTQESHELSECVATLKLKARRIQKRLKRQYLRKGESFDPSAFAIKEMGAIKEFAHLVSESSLTDKERYDVLRELGDLIKPKEIPVLVWNDLLSRVSEEETITRGFDTMRPIVIKRKALLNRVMRSCDEITSETLKEAISTSRYKEAISEYLKLVALTQSQLEMAQLSAAWKEHWENELIDLVKPNDLSPDIFKTLIDDYKE